MIAYHHTQVGRALMIGLLALAACLVALVSVKGYSVLVAAAVLAVVALVFCTLTITIEDGQLRVWYGPGLVCKRCPVADVASVQPIKISWWWGWGIRLTPRGWLFNVSGWDAVEITTRQGRRFLLGTDQPEELAAAIRRSASAR